jgi:hypothetical protein
MQKKYALKIVSAEATNKSENFKKTTNKKFSTFILVFFAFLGFFNISSVFGQTTDSFTTTGTATWTAPCDVTSITVEAWGAGGGGQRANGNPSAGGGGAGGGYVRTTYTVTPGTTYNLFVGAGGSGNSGQNGQGSWFDSNTTIFAVGGIGAGAAVTSNSSWGTGATALTTGNIGGLLASTYGGNGGNAGNNFSGGGGSSAGNTNGNNASGITGGTAPTNGYAGVNGINVNGSGNTGNIGTGGSGGRTGNNTDRNGGAGGRGEIRITYTSLFSYCSPAFTTSIEPITNVTFAGINNTTSNTINGTPALESFCITATVMQGSAVNPISIKGNTDGNFTNYVRAYIDWDQNGVFGNNPNEIYDLGTIVNSTGIDAVTLTSNITVPATASLGITKMRILKNYNAYVSGPCSSQGYGQAEDYSVNVTPAALCAGTPTGGSITVTPNLGAPGSSYDVTASGFSTGSGITYQWQYSDTGAAPWTNQGAASSTYSALTGMIAPAIGTVRTWRLLVTCTNSGTSTSSSTDTFTPIMTVPTTGNNSFTTCSGNIFDNGGATGNYATSSNGYTVINPSTPGSFIRVSGTITAEAGYDYLTIYDGTGTGGTILWGGSPHGSGTSCSTFTVPTITSTTGPLTIQFYSDGSNNCSGFDLSISCYTPLPCVAPTAQPTALILTPTGTSISGSFTAAVPSADNYLVVINTTGTPPSNPVNGNSYAIGATLGAGNFVVDNDTNTAFTATGLTPLTTYYFFIYSFNSACTGGPLYLTTTPLTGNTTTLVANYCTPSVGVGFENLTYFTNISFVGTLNDVSNNSTFSSAPRGYEDFSTLPNLAIQAQGQGINISTQTTNRGYMKAWVDWNQDGDFDDAGELVYDVGGIASYSTTFGFVVPIAQAPGNYRIRIRINKDDNTAPYDPNAISTFDSCQNIDYYGETEDYLFTVIASCNAIVTSVANGTTCGTGAVTLSATASGSPSEYRWYSSEFGGTQLATTPTGSWTTPSISSTTHYWVTAYNGCESHVRTKVTAIVSPLASISFTPSVPEVCGENNVLSLTASGDVEQTYLINEDFESGLGVMTNQNIITNGGTIDPLTQWQTEASTFVPSQQVWFPAIASGLNGNNFAISTSDVGSYITHNAILSPVVNTNTYLDLTLSFDIFYSRYYVDGANLTLDYVTVDVSTDGGTAWTEIDRYTADIGYGTRFENKTYDLSAYINEPNFRVRVRYYGEWCDGLAIDNFHLYGNIPLNTAFDWSAGSPVDAYQDAACTIPYISGTPIVTVYVKPNLSQLENSTYSFTATAVLSNGCSVSQNVSVDNKSKVWKGTSSDDWNDPNNWLPAGVPDITNCVIIPDVSLTNASNVIGSNYNGFGKTLQVKDNGILNIASGNTLTIQNFVEVSTNGTFEIENSASLIQVDNVANTGNISMKRDVNIRKLDYVYWSSPVANFALNNISTTMYRYKWLPTIGANVNGWGNWALANENMVSGKGYIVRGPDSFTATPQNYTQNFIGVPNNGTINMPISRGSYDGANYSTGVSTTLATKNDDNWNLIGNPYPSAISANTFLATNTNIAGFIKFWTHSNLPSNLITDPFYDDYVQNYTVSDYVTYNATGANPPIGNGNIAAGQGFFVLMNHTSGSTDENVVFDNSMRRNDYRNDLFYRNGNVTNNDIEEKNRIWLNLISPSTKSSTTLVGYLTNATNELDRMYDAPALDVKTNFELYSFSNTDKLNIQGRSLPFSSEDQIQLGVSIAENGIHTIGIHDVDGLFENENQNIYLEDLELGITHNLRNSPYSFVGNIGRNENRFVLKFNNNTLGNEDFILDSIVVYTDSNINIKSSNETIKSLKIHDLLGRIVSEINNVNSNQFSSNNIDKTQSTLLIEVTLESGTSKTFKVLF